MCVGWVGGGRWVVGGWQVLELRREISETEAAAGSCKPALQAPPRAWGGRGWGAGGAPPWISSGLGRRLPPAGAASVGGGWVVGSREASRPVKRVCACA